MLPIERLARYVHRLISPAQPPAEHEAGDCGHCREHVEAFQGVRDVTGIYCSDDCARFEFERIV